MEKEFVSYEIALKLKELGFDEPCFTYYYELTSNLRTRCFLDINNAWTYSGNTNFGFTLAPLYQQAFKWLRNKYDIDFSVLTTYSRYNENTSKKYSGVINNKTVFINVGFYETYEEAELAGLQKMIKIIEKNENLYRG
jgi:hypothetical protein